MTLTPQWLDELRARTSLSTLIGKTVKVTKAGREYKACCPFHNEKTPSFTINDEKGFYHCLAGETLVQTPQGRLPIAELAGRTIEILTSGGLWRPAYFDSYGTQQLWRITLSRNGVRKEIFATSGHRWFVRGRKSALVTTELKAGHRLATVLPPQRRDWTLDPAGVRHGIMFGDGTLYGARYGTVNFHGEKDAALAQWFPDQKPALRTRDNGQSYLKIYGGKAFAHMKALPPIDSPDAYLLGFLAGYLAADGHVAKDGTVMLNSADAQTLESVRDIATRVGIGTYSRTSVSRKGYGAAASLLHRIHFVPSTLSSEMFLLREAMERFSQHKKKFDRLRWTVLSVEATDRHETVYCADVPEFHAFAIDDNILTGNCFGCGAHGDAIRWMTDQRGLPFMEAVKELAATAGMDVPAPDPRAAKRAEQAKGLHEAMAAAQGFFEEQLGGIDGGEARAYLQKRGISDATRRTFGFGYSPDGRGRLKTALNEFGEPMLVEAGLLIDPDAIEPDGGKAKKRDSYDRFRGRLMLPIRDIRGRVIAFGGRILGSGEPKYLNSPDTPLFDKGRTLYNIDRASPASRQSGRVIVVEGYMDVIALAQAGFGEAVAPLGTALTEHQIERLWKMVEVPLLCFDGDSAGQKAAIRAANRALPLLRPGHSLAFATLPPGQDPDDLIRASGPQAMEAVLNKAEPLIERLWSHEIAAAPLDTPEQKAALKQRLRAISDAIAHPDVRAHYAHAFRERYDSLFFARRDSAPSQSRPRGNDSARWQRDKRGNWKAPIPPAGIEVRAIGASGMEQRLLRAILAALLRHPEQIAPHREMLSALQIGDPLLARLLAAMIGASFRKETVETQALLTILGQGEVYNMAKGMLRADTFTLTPNRMTTDPDRLARDLEEAVRVMAQGPELETALVEATRRFENDFSEENFAEQQRIRALKADHDRRLAELAQSEDSI
ncbi:DNA primase [Sphingobium sp. BYY-5]|uniref:DNA primase n=1 Tax=Sphingobium sp. BYY-5 TaxID=2926400 RepID=UPI001FA77231|nr:DNA primase [Sphingobium sp. BYY-5]MCI4589985.1 DNA primase [Sphingobium sp. BYY-5]